MKKIYCWEPWFFMFFGLFHLHRIWGLFDRESYASFWMGILENKGVPYYATMGVLALLCVAGIVVFIRERKHNYWWRMELHFWCGHIHVACNSTCRSIEAIIW